MEFETPIDEIYDIRRRISERYDHDSRKYFDAMAKEHDEFSRQGYVYWGYNEAGELAPLPMEDV